MASHPAFIFKSNQASTVRYTSQGLRVRVKLPASTRLPITKGTTPTPAKDKDDVLYGAGSRDYQAQQTPDEDEDADDDEDEDPSFVGTESEELQSSDDEECEESNDDDGDDDTENNLSDEDSEEFDDEIPEEEVTALLLEAKEVLMPIITPPEKKQRTDDLPGTVSAALDDKEGEKTAQAKVVEERDTVNRQNGPPPAWNTDFGFSLPESPPMNLSEELLFNEVFKIREIDHKFHICRGLDSQGALCTVNVPRSHSFSIKLLQKSVAGGTIQAHMKSLAMYSLCDEHKDQSTKLVRRWSRQAMVTRPAREYWLHRRQSIPAEHKASSKQYGEFAADEVRRVIAQDRIALSDARRTNERYVESQRMVESLRTKVNSLQIQDISVLHEPSKNTVTVDLDKISVLEKRINDLTTENSSFEKVRESAEIQFTKERERDQRDLLDAKILYRESQETVEALRIEVADLKSHFDSLETKATSLADSLDSTQAALATEEVRSRELEIRLEERMALGAKTEDSPETKLEKYLREELEKSQSHALQQQKDFEKLRDEQLRLQIANSTLENQVKQIEAAKEELIRASERQTKELTGKNLDLSSQLHNSRAQFEQLKEGLAAMEKENKGEASKSKFSLRDFYRRPKNELTGPPITPADK